MNDALTRPLVAAGITAGAMRFAGARLDPFVYVVPHPSPESDHVAYFSPRRAPEGISTVELAQVTFGFRDGAPLPPWCIATPPDGRRTAQCAAATSCRAHGAPSAILRGTVHIGRLRCGGNPVCVTFELLIRHSSS